MKDPKLEAYYAVEDTMEAGLKKHAAGAWAKEPVAMHLFKAAGHATSANHILHHPEFYTADKETYLQHINQALTRLAMARAILILKKPQ